MLGQCRRVVAGCALAGLFNPVLAASPEPGQLDLQVVHEHSRGHYGTPEVTAIGQTTLTLRYHGAGWSAEVQWPWLRVGTAAEGVGAGLPDSAGRGGSHEQGQGDVWWLGRLALRAPTSKGVALDLAFKYKLASGNLARGLGSGGRDWAVQLEFVQALPASAQLFGHLGWRNTGDVAGYAAYRNPWFAELGAQWAPVPALDLGAYLTVREPVGRLGAQQDATVFAAWRAGAHRWQIYASRGFAPASADLALGLGWRERF